MKKLIAIAFVTFNLAWNGFENVPLKVVVQDQNRQTIETTDVWSKNGNVYEWNVYRQGKLLTFLKMWQGAVQNFFDKPVGFY